ncbi:uncharacterized protein LOC124933484 [Impatiens glandulifera]|uniref:uncharacterized protein LOC124933484 n=1 Tax=Impatiens glandulifera TaxID=253017 RepID=UPI001FB17CE1|nr:uncharacterized protein LOC124933484 [Impatiens glandulifera]
MLSGSCASKVFISYMKLIWKLLFCHNLLRFQWRIAEDYTPYSCQKIIHQFLVLGILPFPSIQDMFLGMDEEASFGSTLNLVIFTNNGPIRDSCQCELHLIRVISICNDSTSL